MKPKFFKTPTDFRAWLAANHDRASELLVGFYKRESGKPSITWPESVDEALCFGWIDGVRRRIDDASYSIRFTPRRRGSIWSVVNTKRAAALIRDGRMHASGLAAFEARDRQKTKQYSFEREVAAMPKVYDAEIRANPKAWAYLEAAPPYYRRLVTHWVTSAKQEDTRRRRLAELIESSARGSLIKAAQVGKQR